MFLIRSLLRRRCLLKFLDILKNVSEAFEEVVDFIDLNNVIVVS